MTILQIVLCKKIIWGSHISFGFEKNKSVDFLVVPQHVRLDYIEVGVYFHFSVPCCVS